MHNCVISPRVKQEMSLLTNVLMCIGKNHSLPDPGTNISLTDFKQPQAISLHVDRFYKGHFDEDPPSMVAFCQEQKPQKKKNQELSIKTEAVGKNCQLYFSLQTADRFILKGYWPLQNTDC